MSDALERLKNRNRPTVPDRDASLTPPPQPSITPDISTSRYQDSQTSKSLDSQISQHPDSPAPLKTKQTTLRLEHEMSDRLQSLCRENGICREVLIEALFDHAEADPELLQTVLTEAISKNEQRQQIANLKRAKSMMERFGKSEQ